MKKTIFILLGLAIIIGGAVFIGVYWYPNNAYLEEDTIEVKLEFNNGNYDDYLFVANGAVLEEPSMPTKAEYVFEYWAKGSNTSRYNFNEAVTRNFTLKAVYSKVATGDKDIKNKENINLDIEAIKNQLKLSDYQINTLLTGPVSKSNVHWFSTSKYISKTGIISPLLKNESVATDSITARFTLNGTEVIHEYSIELTHQKDVVITNSKSFNFNNTDSNFSIPNSTINLYYDEQGNIPYVNIENYLNMIKGFVRTDVNFNYTTANNILKIDYLYYDQITSSNTKAELFINHVDNTLVAPNAYFFQQYIAPYPGNEERNSTKDYTDPNFEYIKGSGLSYDLDNYSLDIVNYENQFLVPYFVVNQLFGLNNYYNVYYSAESTLYGITGLPTLSSDAEIYDLLLSSNKNNKLIEADMVIHNFNYLAFVMDNMYGLKTYFNIESYYPQLFELKNYLLNPNPAAVETGIATLIGLKIDEPHSSYNNPGYYNDLYYTGPNQQSFMLLGDRTYSFLEEGVFEVQRVIDEKWGISEESIESNNPNRPKYWFLDQAKTTAVLTLDTFNTSFVNEYQTFNQNDIATKLKTSAQNVPVYAYGNRHILYDTSSNTYQQVEMLIKGSNANDVESYITKLKNDGYGLNTNKNQYEKLVNHNTLAVSIRYDRTYNTVYLVIANLGSNRNQTVYRFGSIDEMIIEDSAIYMEFMIELIKKESSGVKKILLDLTNNTGGSVTAEYRVLGFITNDAFKVSEYFPDSGNKITNMYKITNEVYDENLTWGLLISRASFSAANQLATIFKDNNLGPVIGIRSGGGASSVGAILLPIGSGFNISSMAVSGYRTGAGTLIDPYQYVANEAGIVPNHIIDINDLYNENTLLNLMNMYS